MKYLAGLLAGMIVGAALLAAALYWNPFAGRSTISPLAVADGDLLELDYSLSSSDAIAYVDDGDSGNPLHPGGIEELWEPTVNDTTVRVAVLRGSQGEAAGIGVKFATRSERSRLLNADVLVDSVWHIRLADGGTMLVEQTENRWAWLRDVVLPGSIGDGWRGSWYHILTTGPNAIGTGAVTGGSGPLNGVTGEAVEAWRAAAWSAEAGPVDVDGVLTLSLPRASRRE